MARMRTIKPAFFLNEDLAALPWEWRLLYIGLWTQADKAGRLEDRPARLKAALFPYDGVELEVGLATLADLGLIVRYHVGDERLIAIPTWAKHQHPHFREPDSELPGPGTAQARLGPGRAVPGPGQTVDASPGQPGGYWYGYGSGYGSGSSSATPLASTEPDEFTAELTFPIVGPGGPAWPLTRGQVGHWAELFPGLDILGECRLALAWVLADGGRRKTAGGMPRFLVGWLTRAVNGGAARGQGPVMAAADDSWRCTHTPPCGNSTWHRVVLARERGEA